MRVALLSDIHGNLVALEAVLAELNLEQPNQVLSLGDVAATGPQPREVIEQLRSLKIRSVLGNTDEWLLAPKVSESLDDKTRRLTEIDFWCAGRLSPSDQEYLRKFQQTIKLEPGPKTSLLAFHGSPNSNREAIKATMTKEELGSLFEGTEATILAGGHTHEQILRRFQDRFFVNPGSVGLPYVRDGGFHHPPWAEYAIVRSEQGSLGIEFRRAPVDVNAVVKAALESDMPHAEWWIETWKNKLDLW